MTESNIISLVQEMRQKYLYDKMETADCGDFTCKDLKKAKKIKKKLIGLEKERCHKLIEHEDISLIDQKIALLKEEFRKESNSKQGQDIP
ncbi:MAG: hypothetical protein WAW70_01890 [Streptococcus parauberis]